MAGVFSIHRETYGEVERNSSSRELSVPPILKLREHEKLWLLRKRSGKTQKECATEMGITRYWFNQMELGKVPNEPLKSFWRRNAG